jgi:hypothetical protein
LGIDIQLPAGAKGTNDQPVVIFVANAAMEDSIKELLWLTDKASADAASSAEEDRLVELARAVSSRGLVKFGGDPFFRTQVPVTANSGTFKIPAVPAGRSYLIKIFIFDTTEDIVNVEDLADVDIEYENQLFSSEDWTVPWASWALVGTPVTVTAGATETVSITVDVEL